MTPDQKAAARTAHAQAVTDLQLDGRPVDIDEDPIVLVDVADRFIQHTEVLAGHLALALDDGPADTYARLNR